MLSIIQVGRGVGLKATRSGCAALARLEPPRLDLAAEAGELGIYFIEASTPRFRAFALDSSALDSTVKSLYRFFTLRVVMAASDKKAPSFDEIIQAGTLPHPPPPHCFC